MAKSTKKLDDTDFEIQFYEGVLDKAPDFFEALSALGDLYTKKGRYKEGLKVDLRLIVFKPDDPIVLYNLACSYSLLEDIDKALVMFKKAIKFGYSDFAHLQTDSDLENLKKDARFKRYMLRIKKKEL
ncbi:MAG: tetratricopeptide repeat protein [Candidatus Zapsychrus exili]|nr:tetratricopeptide repeat protein [Candidatus Zapsychrus exili]